MVVVDEPSVSLHGHVRFPGTRSLRTTASLRDLVGDLTVWQDDPYLLFGVISRMDRRTLARRLILFNPADVIAGRADERLSDRDEVRVFGYSEVRRIVEEPAPDDERATGRRATARGEQLAGTDRGRAGADGYRDGSDRGRDGTGNRRAEAGAGWTDRERFDRNEEQIDGAAWNEGRLGRPERERRERDGGYRNEGPRDGLLAELGIRRLMLDNAIAVVGEVMVPGDYPVAGSVTLEDVLRAAGGLARQADTGSIELTWFTETENDARQVPQRTTVDLRRTSAAAVRAPVGSIVRVNPGLSGREDGFILVEGQVQRPGRYDIVVGERLSSVIARAGGLRENAYPYGAVFTRQSVREAEFDARQRALAELNRALVRESTGGSDEERLRPESLGALRDLVAQIESSEPIGRMVIEADPNILLARPELDIMIEPGDRLFVPRRPWSVFVSGEVFNPGAQQFAEARTARGYLQAAGGVTADADSSRMFIVAPDGSAAQFSGSSWRGGAPVLAPGSAIIVPRDLRPFDPMRFSLGLTQILSSLAVSAGALAVINNN